MDNDWAYNEIAGAKLWDPRCYHNLARICQQLAENAELSLSRALGSLRKSCSRILHHSNTTPEGLLQGHVSATARRAQQQDFLLVASDTTVLNFTSHHALAGLGPIGDSYKARGFLVHSALAIAPEGTPLGVLYQDTWVRQLENKDQAKDRRKRAFADKESVKWRNALQGVEKALPETTKVLLIQDSEGDVFEFFASERRQNTDLLIRVAQAHRVAIVGNQRSSVLEAVMAAPIEGYKCVTIPGRPGQAQREATLALRRVFVQVSAPRHGLSEQTKPMSLWVVAATEQNAPEGVEAVDWILLTTWSVTDAEQISFLVDSYSRRWLIERFHYVLKSGCGFERLQVDTLPALQKALSLFSIVAWRLLYLLYLSRYRPTAPAEEAVSVFEREVLERMEGKAITTVAEVVLSVAKLAGFRPVPSAPVPGVKSLWLGWRKLADVLLGYQLSMNPSPP
jgi:hypothetical protein